MSNPIKPWYAYDISKVYQRLEVCTTLLGVELNVPGGQNLRDFIADVLGIEPMYEDREFSDEQIVMLDCLVSDLASYVKRQIVLSNSTFEPNKYAN